MTSIEYLQIQGIRSFSPKKPQGIKFLKPLTIILGANGAGKTTIIECLKTATTGELPPNSQRGQFFIHDPKIAGDSEVKAQIRLQFKTSAQKRMVVVRSFQLTMKQKKAEFKQLESAIQTKSEDGKMVASSYRCTELDKLLPELMGVSLAILENVIFCHQEDVNWPLSESSTLKKKFDDIFASTRYTKALENIKKFMKTQSDEIKELQKVLAVDETNKNHATKLKKEKEQEKIKIEEVEKQIGELNKKIATYDEEIGKYEKVYDKIKQLHNELRKAEVQKEEIQKAMTEMYESLEQEFTETDEEVIEYEKEFVNQLESLKREHDELVVKVNQAEKQKGSYNQEFTKLAQQLGRLEQEKVTHERRLENLAAEIYQFADKYGIAGYDSPPYSENQVAQFMKLLDQKISQQTKELQELRKKQQEAEAQLSSAISKAQSTVNSSSLTIQKNQKKLNDLNTTSRNLQVQISSANVSESEIVELEAAAKEAEAKFNQKKADIDKEAYMSKMTQLQQEISKNNVAINKANAEMKKRENEKLLSFKISELKDEEKKLHGNLQAKYEDLTPQLNGTLGKTPAIEEVDAQVKKEIASRKSKVVKANAQLQQVERTVITLKGKVDMMTETIAKTSKDLDLKQKKYDQSCPDGKPLNELIADADQKAYQLREQVSMAESLKSCFENFIKAAKSHKECPVCERALVTEELEQFIRLQNEKIEQTPKHITKKKEMLLQAEQTAAKLRNLQPLAKEIEKIKTVDLPNLEKQKANASKDHLDESKKLDELAEELAATKAEEDQAVNLAKATEELNSIQQAIRNTQTRIKQEELKLAALGGSSDKLSYDDIRQELEQLQKKGEMLNQQLENIRKEHQQRSQELEVLRTTWSTSKDKLQSKQLLFEKSKKFHDQLEKTQKEIQDIQKEIQEEQAKIPKLKTEVETQQQNLDTLRTQHQTEQSEIHNKINMMQRDKASIINFTTEIQRYVEYGKAEELNKVQNQQEKLKIRLTQLETESKKYVEERDEKSTMINKQDVIKRNIDDNLRYRAKRKEFERAEKRIGELQNKLKEISGGVQVIKETELEEKKQKRNKLTNEKANLSGRKTSYQSRCASIDKDLDSADYKDIEQKYRASLIKLQTTQLANKDLQKYYTALEKALMKYHSMKMAEINEIIKELWQKTYRGQDIDTIEIRADNEGTTARRSYNYRVVMKKGDVALDMRGRCSAGQKVLACLIIRLALAEAFCLDCGVLALDEPTTNLDLDNVTSLAEALQVIINERRKQSNFQLVVITHDEDFVQKLGRSEFVDTYYRISKDPETHCTVIEEQEFREK